MPARGVPILVLLLLPAAASAVDCPPGMRRIRVLVMPELNPAAPRRRR